MATRHQTYQMPYGFITIDTETESAPEDFLAGPFDVTEIEEVQIRAGADLAVPKDELVIDSPISEVDAQRIVDEELTVEQWREDNPDAIAIGGSE